LKAYCAPGERPRLEATVIAANLQTWPWVSRPVTPMFDHQTREATR